MGSNWYDGSENDWTNGFVIVWRVRAPDDHVWDIATLNKEIARADVELSMNNGLVVGAGVELLIPMG